MSDIVTEGIIMKRIKPVLAVTVDPDVAEWINEEAKSHRLKVSQYVNQLLAEAMKNDKSEGEQGDPPTRVHGRTGARGQSSLTSSASARRRPDRPPKSQKQPLFSGVVMTNE